MINLPHQSALRILFMSILFLVVRSGYGQLLIQGMVQDVKDGSPVPGARVILIRTGDTVYSNDNGVFLLTEGDIEIFDADELTGSLVGRQGTLAWQYNNAVEIRIYNQLGGLSFSSGFMNSFGRIVPAGLRDGYYFVQVRGSKGERMYSMVVNGEHLLVGDYGNEYPRWSSSGPTFSDSLQVEHSSFYSRKVLVDHSTSYAEIEILRHAYPDLDYLNKLICREAFDMLCSDPPSGHLGEVESVKLIYDSHADLVFFMNSGKHSNHYQFAVKFMGYTRDIVTFVAKQYNNTPERYLYPVTLNYYKGLGIYTFEFFPGDGATCADVEMMYEKLKERSFLAENLFFYSSNDSWAGCNTIPVITANDLYSGQNYLAMNTAETYGYLRKSALEDLPLATLGRHDILLVNGIPFDIPVLAGIITTEYQTPLSHINVLSHNRGTPNMCLRDGFENPLLDSLLDRLVYLRVEYDQFILRPADLEEAEAFWAEREPQEEVILDMDPGITGLVELNEADHTWVNAIGGKAANFSELIHAFESEGFDAPVPEGYFAIPFSWYLEHIEGHGIDDQIDALLSDDQVRTNSAKRRAALAAIREAIVAAPLDPELVIEVQTRIALYDTFERFRFRSSTNAEDLEGFNGAGLYDSYSASLTDESRSVEDAIRKVWASLWNFSAFDEREYFRIDHRSCAMGILVHRSFPDEDANGVAITSNPYNSNHGFVVNVQIGEHSIVDPEPGVLHDQVILYTFSLNGQDPYTYEYIVNSNLLPAWKEHVLEEDELFLLGDYLLLVKRYFYDHVYPCTCRWKDYSLDIEFKVDSEVSPRKLYLKQVRPY